MDVQRRPELAVEHHGEDGLVDRVRAGEVGVAVALHVGVAFREVAAELDALLLLVAMRLSRVTKLVVFAMLCACVAVAAGCEPSISPPLYNAAAHQPSRRPPPHALSSPQALAPHGVLACPPHVSGEVECTKS